jgi:signal peptidase I
MQEPADPNERVPLEGAEGDTAPSDAGRGHGNARRLTEWVVLVGLALLVALVLRTFVVQSFYIPSTSMAPTLKVGDRVLVNKLAYRFGDPRRGDIVVFEAPPGEDTGNVHDLIKRVIGLPGETLEGKDGRVFVDGDPLAEPWLPEGVTSRDFGPVDIPAERYWVLGDNRQDSRDSTFFKSIPRDSLVGEAFIRIWPLDNFGFI